MAQNKQNCHGLHLIVNGRNQPGVIASDIEDYAISYAICILKRVPNIHEVLP
jgi:hypothetical protein